MIKESIKELLTIDEETYGYYQLSLDPLKNKLPVNEIKYVIGESITCGKMLASEMKKKFGNISTLELADNLSLKVTEKPKNNSLEYVYFGTYQPPSQITIYKENISQGTELVRSLELTDFQNVDFEEIILAHEIFHYFEENNSELFINQYEIKLWSLLSYTRRSKLISPSEIAAMAFAKAWLELDFSVNILDFILLYPFNKELAESIKEDMLKGKLTWEKEKQHYK